jgi:hypothetical protein
MNRLMSALIALPLAAAGAAAEAASCKPGEIAGLWVGHATNQKDYYCLVDVDAEGRIGRTSCLNPKTLKGVARLDGRFTVSRDCRVTGKFTFVYDDSGAKTAATFKGRLDAEAGLMDGDFIVLHASELYRFARQW